jgi:signal transduction histidine kinase
VFLSLIALFSLIAPNTWIVSDTDHFYFEMFAVVLSAIIALYCISRAYSLKEKFSLFIGIGFVTISVIDFLHATLSFSAAGNNAFLNYFIPQTWFAGRTFLGAMLVVAMINYAKTPQAPSYPNNSIISHKKIKGFKDDGDDATTDVLTTQYLSSSSIFPPEQHSLRLNNEGETNNDDNMSHRGLLFSLIMLSILAVCVVGISYITAFPDIRTPYLISRPYEIPALVLFSTSLFYFYKRKLYNAEDVFFKGLLGALIIDIFIQIIMSYSYTNFHTAHNVAHILKDSAFFVIVISLALSSIQHNKVAKERAEIIRRQYVKLKETDKMKDEFINIAAHELRTPIQPILGLSEILKSRFSNNADIASDQLEMLEVILRNAKRLRRMTENILDVTKIESHSLKLSKEMINMEHKIKNVIADSNSYIQSNTNQKIEITFESSPNEPIFVQADKSKIFEVLSNLLRNAIKFTERGTITVSLAKRYNDRGNSCAVITIMDTGKGIDADIMPRLFSKFASNDICGGTGLGLFISKNIIEAHGGEIWANNNVDENGKINGAIFTFTLPIANNYDKQHQSELVQQQRPSALLCTPLQPKIFSPSFDVAKPLTSSSGSGKSTVCTNGESNNATNSSYRNQ